MLNSSRSNMKVVVAFLAVAVAAVHCVNKHVPPKVQVYTLNPGKYAKENTLICHVSGFQPPDISVRLFKDRVELPYTMQTDLAFTQNWQFHLTRSVVFAPLKGEVYTCDVTHGRATKGYAWEANM